MFAIKAEIDSVSFHLYVPLVHMNSGEIHMISKIAVQPFSTPNSNISNIERVTIYRYVLGIWNTHDFRRQLSQCLIVEMFALLFNYMDFLLILFLLTKRLIFGYFFRHFLVSTYQETHINHFRRFVYLFQTFFSRESDQKTYIICMIHVQIK